MCARADKVQRDRTQIGMFEWLLFSRQVGRRIDVLFGGNIIDTCAVFGAAVPELRALPLKPDAYSIVVGAVGRGSASRINEMTEAHWEDGKFRMNTWLVGTRFELCDHAQQPDAANAAPRPLSDACFEIGVAPHMPSVGATRGNCGINAMLFMEAVPLSDAKRFSQRHNLAVSMASVATNPAWQSAFAACGESGGDGPGCGSGLGGAGCCDDGGDDLGPPSGDEGPYHPTYGRLKRRKLSPVLAVPAALQGV